MTRSEAIEQAKHATLEQIRPYLPGKLRREGNSYRLVGHSGFLFFSKGQRWRWHWFSQDQGGDLLDFLTKCELGPRMSFQEAVTALTGRPSLEPQSPKHDIGLWTKKALAFCRWCHEQLMSPSGAKVRQWLRDKRGLHVSTIEKFGLGWNPRQFFRTRRDWGVGDGGRLCLPQGVVTPKFGLDGRLVGVTIRRLDDEQARKWGKYFSLPSPFGRPIWVIGQEPQSKDPRAGGWPLVIVEGELDGVLLAQEVPDCINFCCLGSAGRRPNPKSHHDFWQVFDRAQRVFLALDNDEAGQKALGWWLEQWEHTVPLPPPGGSKDSTEAKLAGHDLRQWLLDAFDRGRHGMGLLQFVNSGTVGRFALQNRRKHLGL